MNVMPYQFSETHSLYRMVMVLTVGVLVGLLASSFALGFLWLVEFLNDSLWISARSRFFLVEQPELLFFLTILIPTLGGLIVGQLIHRYVPCHHALGPADAIHCVQTHDTSAFSTRAGAISSLSTLIALGTGASVGQYGPMVALGALIGVRISHYRLLINNLKPIAIGCGVAAAISAAFNAPLAGIIFAHEVILRHYSMQAFAPITVASTVGFIMANGVFDSSPLFQVKFNGDIANFEFALFALTGILSACLAIIFMRLMMKAPDLAARLPFHEKYRPCFAGFILGLVATQLPDVLGIGQEALRFATIEGAYTSIELVTLVTAKLFLTVLCVGFGFAGGVFSPSLLIGVLWGALLWQGVDVFFPENNAGVVVYAICAMMSVASPIIGAPLSVILIVFELTRQYDLTIAAMVSVVFSNLVAYRVFGRSLFDKQLKKRGMDLSLGRDRAILGLRSIHEFANNNYLSVSPSQSVKETRVLLLQQHRSDALIIDNGRLIGGVTLNALDLAPHDAELKDITQPCSLTFTKETTVWQAMEGVQTFVGQSIPILENTETATLIGVITEADVVRAYFELVNGLRKEENAGV